MNRDETPRKFLDLVDVMHRLRRECPWDREQTSRSLLRYLVEEAAEVADAVDSGDDEELRGELGDLLLQILFHAELAGERGTFTIEEVIDAIREKMIRRHPHVFGDASAETASDVGERWERIKAAERQEAGRRRRTLDGIPRALPALARAEKVGREAGAVGFDWNDPRGVLEKVEEEVAELREAVESGDQAAIEWEIGDCLLSLASLARHCGASAEDLLRTAVDRFTVRFYRVESELARRGVSARDVAADELDRLWQAAKVD